VRIAASARSFLHHQVRSMAGSLKHVGEGKWSVNDMRAALEARDRAACGVIAPAAGLYLMRVDYPG
jgi:tRNA pseudouridine38-40 synthase